MNSKSTLRLLGLACLLLVFGCSKDAIQPTNQEELQPPLSKSALNDLIQAGLDKGDVFHWSTVDDHALWSAAVQSDSILAIGFKPANEQNIRERIHEIDFKKGVWKATREKLIEFVVNETNKKFPNQNYTARDLMPFVDDEALPVFDIKVFDRSIVSALRQMPEVRYVDPIGYDPRDLEARDAGCGASPAGSIPSSDFVTTSPNVKIPWNFNNMNIPQAWSYSSGAGITVALLDTGTSPNQENLGSAFNSGLSQGRFINKRGYYVSSWWPWASPDGPNDQCGHGTQMAGLIAGPRGSDGNAVGVAYNSNLLAMRVVGDVVIFGSSETNGVKNGINYAAGRSDVKVLSMSIGSIFWSNKIADAIYNAYNRGKMIIAAAGTSTSFTNWYGVIFPATMSQTVAVTGVKEGLPLQRCNTCHSGGAVDFVAVMQRRNDNDRTSLTLALSGNQPSRISGSSAATATTAGIAALIWARNPGQSRSQVLNKMKNAASVYPGRDGQYGWGLIDALKAVN